MYANIFENQTRCKQRRKEPKQIDDYNNIKHYHARSTLFCCSQQIKWDITLISMRGVAAGNTLFYNWSFVCAKCLSHCHLFAQRTSYTSVCPFIVHKPLMESDFHEWKYNSHKHISYKKNPANQPSIHPFFSSIHPLIHTSVQRQYYVVELFFSFNGYYIIIGKGNIGFFFFVCLT